MNISQLKSDAMSRMRSAGKKPYQLTFFSVAVSVAAAVLAGVVSAVVSNYQGGEGLSGMDTASMLQALEELLNIVIQLATPFWAVGLVAALFAFSQGEDAGKSTLLEGFRRFFPFLRLYLMKALLVIAISTLVLLPAMIIFSATPWFFNLQNAILTNPEIGDNQELFLLLRKDAIPLLVIYGAMLLAVLVPLLYRLRFADYFIITGMKSALLAMTTSFRMTKGRLTTLIMLDISFWWYYLGSAVLLVVCYLDMAASVLGFRLNMDAQTAYWVCYLCYAAGHLALETFARPRVEGANVLLFRAVIEEIQAQISV